MNSPSKLESLALRYAPYVGDLHAFFVGCGMPYGSPEDLAPFAEALTVPGSFSEDMGAIVRSVIYRENKAITLVELLELLVVAAGGSQVDQTADDLHHPVRQILDFVRDVYRSLQKRAAGELLPLVAAVPAFEEAIAAEPMPATDLLTSPEPFADADRTSIAVKDPAHEVDSQPASHMHTGPAVDLDQVSQPPAVFLDESVASDPLTEAREPAPFPLFDVDERSIPDPSARSPASSASPTSFASPYPAPGEPAFSDPTPRVPPSRLSEAAKVSAARPPLLERRWFAVTALWAAVLAGGSGLLLRPPATPLDANAEKIPSRNPPGNAALSLPIPSAVATPVVYRDPNSPEPTIAPAIADSSATDASSGMMDMGTTTSAHHRSGGRTRTTPPGQPPPAATGMHSPRRSPGTETAYATPEPFPGATYPETASVAGPASNRSTRPDRPVRTATDVHGGSISVSSGTMSGNLVTAPPPEYPTLARMTHTEGEVILQAFVARDGSVIATHVLRGHHLLRGAAEHAVRSWHYRPYVVDGKATEISTIVTMSFRLHP